MAESPEILSVRERIERRVLEVLAGAQATWKSEDIAAQRITQAQADRATCERWDARGNNNKSSLSVLMCVQSDIPVDDTETSNDITEKTLQVIVQSFVAVPDKSGELPASVQNRQLARIEKALMSEAPNLVDGDGNFLCVDIKVGELNDAQTDDDQPDLMTEVSFEIRYRHPRNDPFTVSG